MLSDDPAERLTLWLRRMNAGETGAEDRAAVMVYEELRRMATYALRGQQREHSLQPTVLVNEAFLKLLKGEPIEWQDRSHFFALASRMMRRIVVDYFRNRDAEKRPPHELALPLDDVLVFTDDRREEALIIDEALYRLAEIDSRAATVVEMRYFGGLTVSQTADALGIAGKTVNRDWEMARWWLKRYFDGARQGAATA